MAKRPAREDLARAVECLLAKTVPATGPGAAVLIACGDEVLYQGARGMASIELDTPMSAAQTHRIGSLSKQFVAAGLLKLVETGNVSLDDALSKFLPGYPNGDQITLRQLLNHTSGVFNYSKLRGVWKRRRRVMTTAGLIAVIQAEPVDFAPGERWVYCDSGYVLIGAVIEAVTGEAWHAYLQRVLFTPLGLTHTRYGYDRPAVPGEAHGYCIGSGGKVTRARHRSVTQVHAAGALVSNASDLLRWTRALHGGEVLGAECYREMTSPTGQATERAYCLGLYRVTLRGVDALTHGGIIKGFLSQVIYVPTTELTVVVLLNASGCGHGLAEALARRLGAIALGDPYPEASPVSVPEAQLKALEGVYRIGDGSSRLLLRVSNNTLTCQRSGGRRRPLMPIGQDLFAYPDGLSLLRIERDDLGAVVGARFLENGEGAGSLASRTAERLPVACRLLERPGTWLKRFLGRRAAGSGSAGQQGLNGMAANAPCSDIDAVLAVDFVMKDGKVYRRPVATAQ